MTPGQVDVFLSAAKKTLPIPPNWVANTSRVAERRCYLSIAVAGKIAGPKIELTVYLDQPEYLVINLLTPRCVVRLCMSTTHKDRATQSVVRAPHAHRWAPNRPKGNTLPAELGHAEHLPDLPPDRDAAFAWFLGEIGVESPDWPMEWPRREGLF